MFYKKIIFFLQCTTCGTRCVYGMRLVYIYGTRRGQHVKNSLQKASKFTQSEAINKRKNLNNTGISLTMKFSGITQHIAKG